MIDIFFFGCAADVAGQSFVDDGVEDYAEKMEDGGKSGEVQRSARLEKLKHDRETEEGFVTPKRRKTTMKFGGQDTDGGKEKADGVGESCVFADGTECTGALEEGGMSARVRRSPRLNKLKDAPETKASFVTPNYQKTKIKIDRGKTDDGNESGLNKTKKQLEERELGFSELGQKTNEVGEGDKSVHDAGNSSGGDCIVGGAEENKGAGGVDKTDAEEVHKPIGLMRAILRIKAAEVQGARDYRGPDMQFVTRAEHGLDTDNKVAANDNDEQNTNLEANDVKKDEIYEARFVCDQEVAKMVEMEAKDSKHDEWNEKEDPKIENEVRAASDGKKEESGGVVFSSAEGAVDDKDEQGVLDGEGKGAVDETDRVFNAAEGKIEHDGMHATILNMQGCSSAGVDLVSGDGFEKAHVVDGKGKAAEDVPPANNNVCEGDTVFDERNLDGPNWSLGMTQIGSQVDVSQEIGCTSGKMDDISRTETERSGDMEATTDLSMVIMVDPVSSYDPAIAIHKGQTGLGSCGGDMYEVEDNIPLANRVRMLAELGAQKRKLPFREKVAAEPNRSPYYIRTVDVGQPITKKETSLWEYIYADESPMHLLSGFCRRKRAMEANVEQGSSSVADVDSPIHMAVELLFRSPNHVQASRSMFKSLNIGNEVSDGIIDCWAEVLNFQEKRKSREAYSRQFFGTKVVFLWMLTSEEGGVEARMHKFRLGIKGAVNRVDYVPDFRNQDIVFFPILEHKHFYLLVFELRDPGIYVVDNDKARQGQLIEDSVYYLHKDTAYKIKDMFVQYLREVGNPRADDIEYCNIQRMPVPWATTANTTDCGVFLMRHMECYMGKKQNFNCGFSTSGARKMAEVRKLRKRYAAHILCSEVNVLLPKIKEDCRIE
ncbi:putative Ulp1 protease family catalytic domain, papain-like cysteine peptidase superfamily [Helianthus annuus]|nr:putative Ulp1 protease family catalytic domain, papain-like cysteine peptidase superfamily [Helianthus annuus]KAJ0785014.1 putative Ulp1 protease family catalytic domain, papain-like cysteine peptidase superfamily [Helianthus annuus]